MSDPAAQAAMAAAIAAAVRSFNIELWTTYAVGVLMTVLRTFARVKSVGVRDLRADDFIVWLSIVRITTSLRECHISLPFANAGPTPQLLYSAQSTLAYFAVNHGQGLANNAMTDAERAALSVDSTEYQLRVFGSKIQVVGWSTYSCLIFSLKIAVLVFYIRLMQGLSNRFRIRIWVGFGLVIVTWLATFITIFSSCRPLSKYWQINPDPGNACQGAVTRPVIWVSFTSSIVTDIYLIMIPIPMLWGTSMKLGKKIAATIVLGAGVFVLICSLLKTVFVIIVSLDAAPETPRLSPPKQGHISLIPLCQQDPIHGAQLAGEWGTREAFVSVVTTNLPMIFPLFKTWLKPLFGSAFSSDRTPSNPTGFRTIGGGDGESRSRNRRRRSPSAKHNSTPGLSYTESEERIINDVKMQNLNVSVGPAPTDNPSTGIVVSKEFQIAEDRSGRKGEHNPKRVPESW
ncbi:uncharacterized protein BP5553_07254 [Venustampulla echinocandica]|uniref:Rhodopsin domain-containing protein n=1 Tax=Venustampulla echinocandica TaxID=2656787 RepID=A0A370TIZ4_9HELO|nr:uncharacterized protein BP5553_07254 [Venustampulla echinocandica]RDL35323.1 hypothetical protein BP5553_07254 [Venustampulla echinocandica]